MKRDIYFVDVTAHVICLVLFIHTIIFFYLLILFRVSVGPSQQSGESQGTSWIVFLLSGSKYKSWQRQKIMHICSHIRGPILELSCIFLVYGRLLKYPHYSPHLILICDIIPRLLILFEGLTVLYHTVKNNFLLLWNTSTLKMIGEKTNLSLLSLSKQELHSF